MTISSSDIEDLGKSPKRVTTDEGTVTERPVDELIKADKYSNAKDVENKAPHGMRISKFKPGSAV